METVPAHSGPSVVNDSLDYYRSRWEGKAVPSWGKSFELECLNPHPHPETCSGCGFLYQV